MTLRGSGCGTWVGTWSTAQTGAATSGRSRTGFRDQTIRNIVRVSAGGGAIRIRLSNVFGAVPLTVSGKIDEPLPKADSLKKPEPKVADDQRKIEIPLPSDRDMDKMMSFLEQAWRRLVDMANRMQKDVTGKI